MNPVRVAYIGCGAVVERSHLPALQNVESMKPSVLVDLNQSQLDALAGIYGVNNSGPSIHKFIDEFDLAVVATPSATHYEIGKNLLQQGKHVLMEKPLAVRFEEARELVELSLSKQRVLAVSLVRRLLPHFQLFKSLLDSSVIGQVTKFEVEEGAVFNWPVQGSGFFNHAKSGGGVLIDNGAHLLDALLWWLGDFKEVSYRDDAQGGVEADCHLDLLMKSGALGTVKMSRLRNLRNEITVHGELGVLKMSLVSGEIDLKPSGAALSLSGRAFSNEGSVMPTTLSLFEQQYQGIVNKINGQPAVDASMTSAESCLPSIKLIETCYQNRTSADPLGW